MKYLVNSWVEPKSLSYFVNLLNFGIVLLNFRPWWPNFLRAHLLRSRYSYTSLAKWAPRNKAFASARLARFRGFRLFLWTACQSTELWGDQFEIWSSSKLTKTLHVNNEAWSKVGRRKHSCPEKRIARTMWSPYPTSTSFVLLVNMIICTVYGKYESIRWWRVWRACTGHARWVQAYIGVK